MIQSENINQIPTDTPQVYAFRIKEGVGADEMTALAKVIEAAFERHDTIRMLLVLQDFGMADAVRSLSLKSMVTQARSIAHVSHYAVVGAPAVAAVMIETFDKVSPVSADVFSSDEESEAWTFVDARPLDGRRDNIVS